MPLPASIANSLALPVLGSPLFIVSGPELVIAQCKAGIIGSFPALNARPVDKLDEWLDADHERACGVQGAEPEREGRTLRGEPDLPRLERPADARHGSVRPPQGADHHHLAAAAVRDRRGRAFLWRRRVPRRDQREARAQGRRAGRRRADPRLRRRRRACRHAVAVRARARGEAVVQGHGAAVGCDRRRLERCVGARARRRPCLHGHALHRHRRGQRRSALQGGADRACGKRHRLFEPVYGRARQLSRPVDRRRRPRPRQPADRRQVEDEFRLGRQHEDKSLARHLGGRPGPRPDRRRAAGCRTGRAAEGGVCRGARRFSQARS